MIFGYKVFFIVEYDVCVVLVLVIGWIIWVNVFFIYFNVFYVDNEVYFVGFCKVVKMV